MDFLNGLLNNTGFRVLIIVIALDVVLGCLRAIRERKINSTIGIDGIIRKVAMIISVIFLSLLDKYVNINLLGFIPDKLAEMLKLERLTINGLFTILFIIFEFLSIFKNMIFCKLPIPRELQARLEEWMKKFTGEIKEEEKNA